MWRRRCRKRCGVHKEKRAAMSQHLFDDEEQTAKYRLHRPGYPTKLYDHIINYYFEGKQSADEKIPLALDVGCGSGQATVDLSLSVPMDFP